MNKQRLLAVPVSAVVASLALVGCSPRDDAAVMGSDTNTTAGTTAGTTADPAATVNSNPPSAGQPQSDASIVMGNAADATRSAVDAAGDKVADASITTMVNAELAKDEQLSALAIDVDTVDGRVALKGEAPTVTAKERATMLAQGVRGVKSVENQLEVVPPKS